MEYKDKRRENGSSAHKFDKNKGGNKGKRFGENRNFEQRELPENVIYGRNAILELLKREDASKYIEKIYNEEIENYISTYHSDIANEGWIQKIKTDAKNITVITNSIRVLNELSGFEGVKVISVGGVVSKNQSFVGNIAEQNLEVNYFANKMFFSSKGIGDNSVILEGNEQECYIKQTMIKNSRLRYYLCDKSKIGRVGYMRLTSFENISHLVTDAQIDGTLKETLEEYNVEIIQA